MVAVDAVCFDLDDTLFPYEQYVRAGLAAAADRIEAECGTSVHAELAELYFAKGATDGTFDRVVSAHDLDVAIDPLVEAFHSRIGDLEPYPGVPALLDRLGESTALGVITDGRNGRAKLERLGLAGHFDAVTVTPTHEFTKRDPAAFEQTLSKLGVPPHRAMHVGDNPKTDFPAANSLGMTTVRLRKGRYTDEPAKGRRKPDFEIDAIEELSGVVAQTH